MTRTLGAVVLAAAIAMLAGCGGDEPRSTAARVPAAADSPAAAEPPAAAEHPVVASRAQVRDCVRDEHGIGGDRVAYAAVARRETVAYRSPGGERLASFGLTNENRHATVFGVRRVVLDQDCQRAWYRVRLPMRPNGIEGYVRAGDVHLYRLHTRIVVDLSERQLTLFRDGEPVLRTSAAIGAPETPTPTGRFYVNQRLIPSDPTGPWGPGAVGISAFSDVLRGWTQGGPIAIHGTNEPSSIGTAASHGCVRLPNDVLRKVFAVTDAGTPVIIQA